MSRINCSSDLLVKKRPCKTAKFPTNSHPLHRIRKVRRQEGVGLRAIARHMDTTVDDVKYLELATTDLPLSVLRKFQEVLRVPVAELLSEPDDSVSAPLLLRARLVRVMKTAMTLLERSEDEAVQRMSRVLVNQLLEIMPELHDISPWKLVGQRRGRNDYGRALEHCISEDLFTERTE
jgi:hypothetical protein